jgi:hypothetical protein
MCVSAVDGSATRANLERNGAIATGFCPPTIAKAVQLKGTAEVLGEPSAEDLERVQRHLSAFLAECGRIGVPDEISERMFDGSNLVMVKVSIQDGFDQTPGPTAGRRL